MTVPAPFDGSVLSTAALENATTCERLTETDVVVLAAASDSRGYARGRLLEDERFDHGRTTER